MSKILVNALSAQLGGGQTHLLNIFNSQNDVWKDDQILFLVSESNAQIFERAFGKKNIINIGALGNKFFLRAIWENLFLSHTASKHNVNFVFLAAGIAPFFMTKKCIWVTISHNLLPFSWKNILNSNGFGFKVKLLIIRYIQLWTFQNTNGVIFISQFAKKIISQHFKKTIPNIVIPSGINIDFFTPQENHFKEPYILYVSTFFEYKHQKEILQAYRLLVSKNVKVPKLIFVGSNQGAYGDECKSLCNQLGLNDYVIFKGNIPYSELPSIMQHSSINLFASDCENCPNILLEYLASRRPILCSNFEPMPEFGKDFVTYFDPTNPTDLADKIEVSLNSLTPIPDQSMVQIKDLYNWNFAANEMKSFLKSLL